MALSKMLAMSLTVSTLLLQATGSAWAQGATADRPVLRSAKERGATPQVDATETTVGGLSREQRITICLDTWDAQTHMTRREWRTACERSVRVEPGIYR